MEEWIMEIKYKDYYRDPLSSYNAASHRVQKAEQEVPVCIALQQASKPSGLGASNDSMRL